MLFIIVRTMNPRTPDFTRLQYTFTRYIRNPEQNPMPAGVAPERMQIYRSLIFNNLSQFLANYYPVLHRILPESAWDALIQDFLEHHQASTPLFSKLPEEFLHFLGNERDNPEDPVFLFELAHYEWVEAELHTNPTEPDMAGVEREGDLLKGIPVLSPLAWPLAYHFPVHRISPDFQPTEPGMQPTYLVVYRNSEDAVKFLEINPVTARLLELIRQGEQAMILAGEKLLRIIAQELQHPNPAVVIKGGQQILEDLRSKGVILGITNP